MKRKAWLKQKQKFIDFQQINYYDAYKQWPKYVASFITSIESFGESLTPMLKGEQLDIKFKQEIAYLQRRAIQIEKSKKQQEQLQQYPRRKILKAGKQIKKKKIKYTRMSVKLKCLFNYLMSDLQSKQIAEFRCYILKQPKQQSKQIQVILDLIIKQQIFSQAYSAKIQIVDKLQAKIKEANQQFNQLKHRFQVQIKKHQEKFTAMQISLLNRMKLMSSVYIDQVHFESQNIKQFKSYHQKFQQIKSKKQQFKKQRSQIQKQYLNGKHSRMAILFFMYLFGVKVRTPALIKPLFNRNTPLVRYKHHYLNSHSLTVQRKQIQQIFQKSIQQRNYLHPYIKNQQTLNYLEEFIQLEKSILKISNNLLKQVNCKVNNPSPLLQIATTQQQTGKLAQKIIFQICKNNFSNDEKMNNQDIVNTFNNSQKYLKPYDQPKLMKSELKPYQLQAVTWMKYREGRLPIKQLFSQQFKLMPEYDISSYERELSPFWEQIQLIDRSTMFVNHYTGQFSKKAKKWIHTRGGILADQMGLGKTVMTLGLIVDDQGVYEDSQSSKLKPFKGINLIVVPVNVINQWQKQIQLHINYKLKVYCYHEDNKKRYEDLGKYDFVFTTYATLGIQFKKYRIQRRESKQINQKEERYIFDYYWRRIILDEAQNIKTKNSLTSEAANCLQSDFRWCLTGTPFQNNTEQLYSIVRFLKLEVFSQWNWWRQYITNCENTEDKHEILHTILKPIMLRRTKQTKYREGSNIIELPGKKIIIIRTEFSESQQKNYDLLKEISMNHLNQILQINKQTNYTHVFQIIGRLRQFCSHPCLVLKNMNKKEFQDQNLIKKKIETFFHNQLKIPNRQKQSLMDQLKNQQFYNCPICLQQDLDIYITFCGHKICNKCTIKIIDTTKNCPMCRKPITEKDMKFIQRKKQLDNIYQQSLGSSKLNSVMKVIYEIQERQEKCVIFSQWIKILDILGDLCSKQKFKWTRIDGSLNKTIRSHNLNQFKNNINCRIIFISLKAGATGLNLTSANNVLIIDPWWNPAQQDQATERVYRFGQTKAVTVYKFIVKNSIQQKIIKLHEKKRKEINQVLMNGKGLQKKNEMEQMIQLLKD